MKIAVYGATGAVGSQVVAEALGRGHEVTAVSRSGTEVAGTVSRTADISDTATYRELGAANDAVVIAVPPSRTGGDHQEYLDAFEAITETLIPARLLVVGGAGATEVGGVRLVDTPGFPEEYKAEASTCAEVYDMFTSVSGITWTVAAPAPVIAPGRRTGSYTLGTDSPAGEFVSTQDFAVAILDELETPAHENRRLTVASEK
ncbi:NAD(P)H-binding protein [Glutamicibacter sp. MNS18]|uniref:NAD(P)-dependent oxidoreductase n=1 Tax=Glutamicibacter sp. MNS18 TaxID=2989817 RepID=UPI002235DE76|nr:NAD(P)H-binding protein [Glutamicibacter sp. MNS18]MCW4465572.1 NAD(P)H-binding protein [Glutamicibacter sp. MNS18]